MCAPLPDHTAAPAQPTQGPSCPAHSWSVDRHQWRASLSGWRVGLRGSGIKGSSQWNVVATETLFLTLKSYLMLSSSVHLCLQVCTSGINAAVSKMSQCV